MYPETLMEFLGLKREPCDEFWEYLETLYNAMIIAKSVFDSQELEDLLKTIILEEWKVAKEDDWYKEYESEVSLAEELRFYSKERLIEYIIKLEKNK